MLTTGYLLGMGTRDFTEQELDEAHSMPARLGALYYGVHVFATRWEGACVLV